MAFREAGYTVQLREQQESLPAFHTVFDVWFSERSLHDSDDVVAGLDKLRGQGHLFDADGALWMRTTDFGDDRDRVLIRTNGELTYFASDTAYYVNKRERGFDRCLYLLGADHHGYVGRLKAMAACAGDDPDRNIEVLIGQLVKIMRDGEEVRMSKRAGELDHARRADRGHRRRRAALLPRALPRRLAAGARRRRDHQGLHRQPGLLRPVRPRPHLPDDGQRRRPRACRVPDELRPALLTHDRDRELLRALAEFPRVVAAPPSCVSRTGSPATSRTPTSVFNKWYDTKECRMLPQGDEPVGPVNEARLMLVVASRTVLANGLDLLGVSAPERM